jgi:8-oxo-dGTP diphosphatase
MEQNVFKAGHIVTSVVAVIVDSDEQVLLTKRSVPPFQGEWVMPGGKIDLGEPIVKALKREVLEEVGLEVEVGDLIDIFEHVTPGVDNYHFIIIYYRCTPLYCDVRHNDDEIMEARWVPRDEIRKFKLPAGANFILGKIFPELCECR